MTSSSSSASTSSSSSSVIASGSGSASGSSSTTTSEESIEQPPPLPPLPSSTPTSKPSSTPPTTITTNASNEENNKHPNQDGSILFQPHRTIGLISTSQPYSIAKDKSSSYLDTFVTMPLQERFVIYKCDTLRPVLVSHQLPGTKKMKNSNNDKHEEEPSKGEKMFHAISDASLGLTVASHAYKGRWNASHVTLYKRTKCIHTREIVKQGSRSWGIVQVLNLGRSKFSLSKYKYGNEDGANDPQDIEFSSNDDNNVSSASEKVENCMLLAMICAKHSFDDDDVEMIGSDSDSSDSDSDSDSDDPSTKSNYHGEVVIVVASRTKITIQKRIPLNHVPNFTPSISVHPHTYINKILIGSTDGNLLLLNIRSGKIIHQFKCFGKHCKHGKITALEQSPAIDTIAVGTNCGKVHLVNIRMDVKLFTLNHTSSKSKHGRSKNVLGVTSMSFRTDASALEHGIAPLAVGQRNGTISVWDLTPRSNGNSDDEDYHQNTKDSRRSLLCQMENAHPGGVCQLNYLPQEPLLLSSGFKSNSLVMHIFDNPNHTGRILRQRNGHVSPPELIRYQYSSNGGVLASMADGTDAAACQIFSCGGKGDRSLRLFSTARSVLDREFSQGKGLLKKSRELGLDKSDMYLNEIIGMGTNDVRSRDWGDLVTIHKDHSMAYVWSSKRKSQSGPVLRQNGWNISAMKIPPPKSTHATAVAISSCGNFAVIGTKGGTIYKYNIQSGLPRGSFPRDATDTDSSSKGKVRTAGSVFRTGKVLERELKVQKLHVQEKDEYVLRRENQLQKKIQEARHQDAAVVGLAIDTLNKTLISVGSDSKLILWSFPTHAPHRRSPILLSSPATKMVHTRDSDLLAIALEDFSVIMFDCSSLSVVRKFGTIKSYNRHKGPITDLAFGPDGRKLFTASLDGSLRVWDVPTSTCVDWMTFSSAPTSLALSATGEFLATSHQGRLGISLWCDRSFFQTVHLGVQPPTRPFQMDEPAAVVEEDHNSQLALTAMEKFTMVAKSKKIEMNSMDEISEKSTETIDLTPKKKGLITLSGLPAAHWKNLFHLELVKQRNKPKEPPKKPPSAPFFLQWRGGESITPQVENEVKETDEKGNDAEWDAVWSDDDIQDNNNKNSMPNENRSKRKNDGEDDVFKSYNDANPNLDSQPGVNKRKKISHARSDLASILDQCHQSSNFEPVTEFLAKMGPSAIDVAFSTLCHGIHDLDEGLPLLHMAALWLLQECQSKKNFEVINAYLHRFLHIHSSTIAGIDASWQQESKDEQPSDIMNESEAKKNTELRLELLESVKQLRIAHLQATEGMRNKLQESLCLLRHFSRIV